ncbi:MAG: hypothetical protein H7Y38_20040, partial [Armatimonadetes bacterium]|nr:hypothetical protein [Armatimonadota bacterium]
AVAQGSAKLTVMRNTVPTDARKIGGKVYVPIADVAKAMGWKLTVSGNRISLQPPALAAPGGNTSLNEARSGAVGEEIRTALNRFQVTKITETQKHDRRYVNGIGSAAPVIAGTGEKLVVLDCVLTNATNAREEYCFSRDRYAGNTALLSESGESLQPTAIDVAADELVPPGAFAPAGANIQFALVFRVPATWQPKALVYTITRYRDRDAKKGTDVRVNL